MIDTVLNWLKRHREKLLLAVCSVLLLRAIGNCALAWRHVPVVGTMIVSEDKFVQPPLYRSAFVAAQLADVWQPGSRDPFRPVVKIDPGTVRLERPPLPPLPVPVPPPAPHEALPEGGAI